jgi:hypothetical protein
VAVTAQDRLPPMYRNEGAFDRNIHLLTTLRASSLLQKTGTRATAIRLAAGAAFGTEPQLERSMPRPGARGG